MERTAIAGEAGGTATLFRMAGWAALASSVVSIPMIGALVAMFVNFAAGAPSTARQFGAINDALTIVTYGLLLPVVPAMHVLVRETGRVRSLVLATVGVCGIVVTMVLQWLLVTGAIPFERQVGMVSVSILAAGAWMVGTGYLARSTGFLPNGVRNGVLGGLYLGFPIWALDLGRRLVKASR